MSQRIDLAGLKESIDELVRLASVLREARTEFINTAEASSKVKDELNKGTSNFKQYQQQTERIVEVNARVASSSKTVLETEREKRKAFGEVVASVEAARKANEANTKSLEENLIALSREEAQVKASRKTLTILNEAIDKDGKLRAEYTLKLKQSQEAIKDLNRTVRNQVKENEAAGGSINQLRAQLNQLLQGYDNLSKADRDGIIGKEMLTGVKDLTTELKALEEATGRAQRNVGNYPTQFNEIGVSIKTGFKDILNGNLHKGFQAFTMGVKGFTRAAMAFVATPIGAVVTALGIVIAALAKGLNSTQKGMDAVNSVLRPMTAVFESLLGVLQNVVAALMSFEGVQTVFSDLYAYVKDKVLKQFEAMGKVLHGITTFDFDLMKEGFGDAANLARELAEDIAEAGGNVKNFFGEAIEAGNEIHRLQMEIEEAENELILTRAKIERQLKEQERIARDINASLDERKKANGEILRLTNQLSAAEDDILNKKIKQMEIQHSFNDTSRADQAEMNKLIAERDKRETEAEQRRIKAQRINNQLEREAESKRKQAAQEAENKRKQAASASKQAREKARAEEIAMNQALLDNYILTNQKRVTFDENFTTEQLDNYKNFLEEKNRLEIENLELQAGTTYEDALAKSAENRTAIEQRLINDVIRLNQAKDEELRRLDEDYVKFQEDLAKRTHESLKKDMATRLAYAVANGEDLKEIERDYYKELYELDLQRFENLTSLSELEILNKIETNDILTDLEREYADAVIAQRQRLADWKEEDANKEKEQELERQNHILSGITRAIGYEQELRQVMVDYNAMMNALALEDEQAYQEARLNLTASVANTLGSIIGKETVFGKALAVAQIAMDTATAVMRVTAQAPLAAPYLVPAIIALGAAQAIKVSTTKIPEPPKFAKGVESSSYEGVAIVDELGAELHFDKKGNLKSFGEDYGARFTYVEKGDTIIPAHKSKALMDGMPNLYNSLLLNGLLKSNGNNKGVEKRLDEIKTALSDKENKSYLDLNDSFIIEVTEKNGSTYQRLVKKIGHKNMKQTRLW